MFASAYPAKFTTGSDGRVLVEFVDLPRVATDGKDEREAFEEAMDALGSELSIRLSRREEVPPASAAKRSHRLVPVPLWLVPNLAMREQRVNKSELARRLGVDERVVRRMLDPEHATKTELYSVLIGDLAMAAFSHPYLRFWCQPRGNQVLSKRLRGKIGLVNRRFATIRRGLSWLVTIGTEESTGLRSDHTVILTTINSARAYPDALPPPPWRI